MALHCLVSTLCPNKGLLACSFLEIIIPPPHENLFRKIVVSTLKYFHLVWNMPLMYVRFMVKQLSVWSGDHWIGQKRLIFIRGTLTNGANVASVFSNSYISGTKWLRHPKWVTNWRFLRKLKSMPIFEQVTPSRSSEKKVLGQIFPTLGVIRSKKCRVI